MDLERGILLLGCSTVVALVLVPAAAPTPGQSGEATLFVGGDFGSARTLALDADGRTVARGRGPGAVHRISVCPGGRRIAEIVEREKEFRVAIREVPSLELVRHQRVRPWNQDPFACADAAGRQVVFFYGSGPDLEPAARLVRMTEAKTTTTLWRGTAWYASFRGGVGYVQALERPGTTIVKVDLLTGAARTLGTARVNGVYELASNAAGTRLAGDAYEEGSGDPRLVVIDLTLRPIAVRTIPYALLGSTMWLSNHHFAYALDTVSVFSDTLRRTATIPGWKAGPTTVRGSILYGLRYNEARGRATVVSAETPTGPVRVLRRLQAQSYPEAIASVTG